MTKQPSIRLLAPQAELADVSKHFDLRTETSGALLLHTGAAVVDEVHGCSVGRLG